MTRGRHDLVRSTSDRVLGGVCAGIAHWLGWRPNTVRTLYVLGSVLSAAFPGTLVYLVLWVVMPSEKGRQTASVS